MKLSFPHWVERAVGYEAILLADRRALHRLTAAAIEHADGIPSETEPLRVSVVEQASDASWAEARALELSRHWGRAGDERRACLYGIAAAQDALRHGRHREALALADEGALKTAEEIDQLVASACWLVRGRSLDRLGRIEDASAAFERAVERAGAAGAEGRRLLCRALSHAGGVAAKQMRFDAARQALDEGLAIARATGARREESVLLGNLGVVAQISGDLDEAERFDLESDRIKVELGDAHGRMQNRANRGVLRWYRGDYIGAKADLTANVAAAALFEDPYVLSNSLGALGALRVTLGETAAGLADLDECVGLCERIASGWAMANARAWRALALVRVGREAEGCDEADRAEALALSIRYVEAAVRAVFARSLGGGGSAEAERACEMARKLGDGSLAVEAHAIWVEVLGREGRRPEARAAAAKGRRIAAEGAARDACDRLERAAASIVAADDCE